MSRLPEQKPHSPPTREDRVAEALRENLRKRKQQAQTRALKNDDNKEVR